MHIKEIFKDILWYEWFYKVSNLGIVKSLHFYTIHAFEKLWKKWSALWIFGENNPRSKSINQYDKDWKFIKKWWSVVDATKWTWISQWNICCCCTGKRKNAWGFIWKYA